MRALGLFVSVSVATRQRFGARSCCSLPIRFIGEPEVEFRPEPSHFWGQWRKDSEIVFLLGFPNCSCAHVLLCRAVHKKTRLCDCEIVRGSFQRQQK